MVTLLPGVSRNCYHSIPHVWKHSHVHQNHLSIMYIMDIMAISINLATLLRPKWQPFWYGVFLDDTIRFLALKNIQVYFWGYLVLIFWEICWNIVIWQHCQQIWQPCQSDSFLNATNRFLIWKNMGIQILSFIGLLLWEIHRNLQMWQHWCQYLATLLVWPLFKRHHSISHVKKRGDTNF